MIASATLPWMTLALVGAPANAQNGFTSTTSTTDSGGTTVSVPSSAPLNQALAQAAARPGGTAVINALVPVLRAAGGFYATTTTSQSFTTYTFVVPTTIPVGSNPHPAVPNCSGPPSGAAWPPPNCNMSGYAQFFVQPGTVDIHVNLNTDTATTLTLAPNSAGTNWLLGDLYTTVRTTIIDGEFAFVDGIMSRGQSAGLDGATVAPMAMAFAEVSVGEAPAPGTLAYARPRTAALPPVFKAPPAAAERAIWTMWAKGDYASASFAGTSANLGFGYTSHGGEFGLDYRRGEWLVGGAIGIARSDVTQDLTGDSARIDSVRLGGYASFRPGPWSFTGVLAGGLHGVSADRLAVLPSAATASYDAGSINAGVEAARRFPLWSGTGQPRAGLVYTNLHMDAFAEMGMPFLALASQSADIGSLKGYVGARAWRSFEVGQGWVLTPELRARALYDFLDDPRAFTAAFLADPTATLFAVYGLQPGRTPGLFGGALSLRFAPRWIAFANYDAEVRDGDVADFANAGLKATW